MARPKALVIGHSRAASLRRLGPWLEHSGLDTEVRFGGDGLPSDLDGYDAMLVLGGAPLPNEDDRFHWLPQTRALTQDALDHALPFLGICLGGQLLAYVGGGSVHHRQLKPEHGMTNIVLNPAARRDPLFSVMPNRFHMAQNHVDHITLLPAGAVLLAHSRRSPVQAFRLGPCAWGLQFHPEIGADDIAKWDAETRSDIEMDGFDWTRVVRHARETQDENDEAARRLAERFARIVCGEVAASTL